MRSKEITGPQKQLNPPGTAQRCSSANIEDVYGHVQVFVAAGAAYSVRKALVPAEGTHSPAVTAPGLRFSSPLNGWSSGKPPLKIAKGRKRTERKEVSSGTAQELWLLLELREKQKRLPFTKHKWGK